MQMKVMRELFGLTQQQIAAALKISRSHFSMIEDDQRSAPVKMTMLDERLSRAFGNALIEMQTKTKEPEIKPAITEIVKNKIEDHVIQKQILMKRLSKMKKTYEPCALRDESILQWRKIAEPGDEMMIGMSAIELDKLESKCNRAEQLYLEMQIIGIEAELNFITENMEVPEDLIPAFLKM